MKALLLLGFMLARVLFTSAGEVAPVENVRILHGSSRTVDLCWDWSSETDIRPQFAVSYILESEPIDMISPEYCASLKVYPAGKYQVQIVTLVQDSGKWLESEPKIVDVEASNGEWPAVTNITFIPIRLEDFDSVYQITWNQEISDVRVGFRVEIESSSGRVVRNATDNYVIHAFKCSENFNVRVVSNYRFYSDNGTVIKQERASPYFGLVPAPEYPTKVRNLHVYSWSDGGEKVRVIVWSEPMCKRGPRTGYSIQIRDSRGITRHTSPIGYFFLRDAVCGETYKVEVCAFNIDSNGRKLLGAKENATIVTSPCEGTFSSSWAFYLTVWGIVVVIAVLHLAIIVPYKIYMRTPGETAILPAPLSGREPALLSHCDSDARAMR